MNSPWSAEPQDIERLDATQLVKLLSVLLHQEAAANGIASSSCSVPFEISVPDDGEDGRVCWHDGPPSTEYLPRRFTLFQAKSGRLAPKKFGREALSKDGRSLKPAIQEVLEAHGAYVVFYGKPCNMKGCKSRLVSLRDEIRRACPERADEADLKIYDAGKIACWTNRFPGAVAFVRETLGQVLPDGVQTWNQWSQYSAQGTPFCSSPLLDSHIRKIRDVSSEPKQHLRVIGLSGVGKTRLVFEAFRPNLYEGDGPLEKATSDALLYCKGDEDGLLPLRLARSMLQQGWRGVLVVDECDVGLHNSLIQEIQKLNSSLSLITIDYEKDIDSDDDPGYIVLRPEDMQEVVRDILSKVYSQRLQDWEVNDLATLAEGFPKIATLLAEAHLDSGTHVGRVRGDYIDRLLFGRKQRNDEEFRALMTCALFEFVGFGGSIENQWQLVAESVAKIEKNAFYRAVQHQARRGVIQQRGRFIRVAPRPIATALAREWWRDTPPTERIEVVTTVWNTPLRNQFLENMHLLDNVPEVQQMAAHILSDERLLGLSNSLCTSEGCQVLSDLAEIVPSTVMSALARLSEELAPEKFERAVGDGIAWFWILVKLSWWVSEFASACRLLLKILVATRNSQISSHFLNLFRIPLSGTTAPPEDRQIILSEMLDAKDIYTRELAVMALSSAITWGYASRMGGPEKQGSRKRQDDWYPATGEQWGCVRKYSRWCVSRLVNLAQVDAELGRLAKSQLGERLVDLILIGFWDETTDAVKQVASGHEKYWPEAERVLRHWLSYKSNRYPAEKIGLVEDWLTMMEPLSVAERLQQRVTNAPAQHEKNGPRTYTDVAQQRADDLAKELAVDKTALFENLPALLKGDQQQAIPFGMKLGELIADGKEFVDNALALLAEFGERGNPYLLIGFLTVERQQPLRLLALKRICSEEALLRYARHCQRLVTSTDEVKCFFQAVHEGRVPVWLLAGMRYRLAKLWRPEGLDWLVDKLKQLGASGCRVGALIAAEVDASENRVGLIRGFLMAEGILCEWRENEPRDELCWSIAQAAEVCLDVTPEDSELVRHLVKEVLRSEQYSHFYSHCAPERAFLAELTRKNPEAAWAVIGDALLSQETTVQQAAYSLCRTFDNADVSPVNCVPSDILLEWMRLHAPEGCRILARCVPPLHQKDEVAELNPLLQSMLDLYGTDSELLNILEGRLSDYSWCGSEVLPLEHRRAVLCRLRNHKLQEVRQWATGQVRWYENSIKNAQTKDEEGPVLFHGY